MNVWVMEGVAFSSLFFGGRKGSIIWSVVGFNVMVNSLMYVSSLLLVSDKMVLTV